MLTDFNNSVKCGRKLCIHKELIVCCYTVPVWSSVNVAGTRLKDVLPNIGGPDDTGNWQQVHKDVVNRLFCLTIRALKYS